MKTSNIAMAIKETTFGLAVDVEKW
jgi:hypothetical protein